jgi:hypothetical protein
MVMTLYIDQNTNGALVGPDSDLDLNTIMGSNFISRDLTGINFISFSLTGINFISDPHLTFLIKVQKIICI